MSIVSVTKVAMLLLSVQTVASNAPQESDPVDRCVRRYGELVAAEYAGTLRAAEEMRAAIRAFCEAPTDAGLARAREAWIAARDVYGRTEAFRFGNGPIDTRRGGVETFVNAWPVDEAYIEPADPGARTGIIRDSAKYPALGRAILRLHNQRGGETNVCTGWHAIEFMLWGVDVSDEGPGARPVGDFLDAASTYASRRREFLLEVTDMLCEDLAKLDRAWASADEGAADAGASSDSGSDSAPESNRRGNHRARFIEDPRAMRAILIGPALLAGFEMSGERLAVPLETRDQEEEHSCFSDTTDRDFKANIRGIVLVVRDAGALEVVRARDAERARTLAAALDAAVAAVEAMPAPFDRAMRAADDDPARQRLVAALEALELLGEELDAAARLLGFEFPAEPQG